MGQLRDDLRRTTEQYRELNQALAQQQQQITSLQVSSVRELKFGEQLCLVSNLVKGHNESRNNWACGKVSFGFLGLSVRTAIVNGDFLTDHNNRDPAVFACGNKALLNFIKLGH